MHEKKRIRLTLGGAIVAVILILITIIAFTIMPKESLHDAAGYNQPRKLNFILLFRSASINSVDEDGATPLHVAAWHGHWEPIEILIDNGADIDALEENGRSPLHLAVYNEKMEVIRLLLENEADPDIKDIEGNTALHWMVEEGNSEIVRLLIEYGADVNMKNKFNQRPFDLANIAGNMEIAWLLLLNGARSQDNRTPLHIVAEKGPDALKYFFENTDAGDVNLRDNRGNTPLHYAVHDSDATEMLLGKGADPNLSNEDGNTPLHLASRRGDKEVVRCLLKAGANVRLHNNEDNRPVDIAIQQNSYLLVHIFYELGTELGRGRSALHLAALNWRLYAIEQLIENGLDVNEQDRNGATPLHLGAESHYVVGILLENGADPNIADENGQTPLHIAASHNAMETVEMLVEAGAELDAKDSAGKKSYDLTESDVIKELLSNDPAHE